MYRIVITKEEDVISKVQEWKQLYVDQDTALANGADSTHAYVDKRVEQVKETPLLDQRVDSIDLKRVISAINDMPEFVPGFEPKFRGKPVSTLNDGERAEAAAAGITISPEFNQGDNTDGPATPTA